MTIFEQRNFQATEPGVKGKDEFARKNVGLDTKRRYKEIVDRVFRGHDEFDFATDWHVQFIDFTLASVVLDLPLPFERKR
jgi:hypothetical protein